MECPNHLLAKPEISKILNFLYDMDPHEAMVNLKKEYINSLDNYYREIGIVERVGYQSYMLPRELLSNAYFHGGLREKDILFGIFYSPEAVVVGCNDGGIYFRQSEIKTMWENKEPVKSRMQLEKFNGKPLVFGANLGRRFIYCETDEIFIDNDSGTFFGKFNPNLYRMSLEEILNVKGIRRNSD